MTRALICGDRHWKDRDYLFARLDEMQELWGITEVIEGCWRGADRLAEEWAGDRGLPVRHFPAEWHIHGKAAGPIRNLNMLRMGLPFLVIAFHTQLQQSKGTRHMVESARREGVETFVFPHSHEGYRAPSHNAAPTDV